MSYIIPWTHEMFKLPKILPTLILLNNFFLKKKKVETSLQNKSMGKNHGEIQFLTCDVFGYSISRHFIIFGVCP